MLQVIGTDNLRNIKEINAAEYYTWSIQKQVTELVERLVLNIEKNPKG